MFSVSVAGGELVLASNGATSRAEQQVAVTPGKMYRLGGKLKNGNASAWTYLGVGGSVTNVSNSQGTTNQEAGNNSRSYASAWVEFTASAGTVTVYASPSIAISRAAATPAIWSWWRCRERNAAGLRLVRIETSGCCLVHCIPVKPTISPDT